MTKTLDGKSAGTTCAARSIGLANANRFAGHGAFVVINYLTRKDEAERTISAIQAEGGAAFLFQADIP